MEQNRAGGGARRLRNGVPTCEFRGVTQGDGAGAAKVRAETPAARQAVSGSDKEYCTRARAPRSRHGHNITYIIMFITHVNNEA